MRTSGTTRLYLWRVWPTIMYKGKWVLIYTPMLLSNLNLYALLLVLIFFILKLKRTVVFMNVIYPKKKSSLRTHIRNSHPNHDLSEVEARSIIAQSGGEETADHLTLPSLMQNQNVAQNLLSILSMANGEASNISNSESVSEINEELESSSDEKMTESLTPEKSSSMEIRNISDDKGEESKFKKGPFDAFGKGLKLC